MRCAMRFTLVAEVFRASRGIEPHCPTQAGTHKPRSAKGLREWAQQDSNLQPRDYEFPAGLFDAIRPDADRSKFPRFSGVGVGTNSVQLTPAMVTPWKLSLTGPLFGPCRQAVAAALGPAR